MEIPELSMERLVHIIASMAGFYGKRCEAVVNYGLDECFLFLGLEEKDVTIYYNEIQCLVDNDILELSCGSDEPGHETEVYVLTDEAEEKIKKILKNKKEFFLKKLT